MIIVVGAFGCNKTVAKHINLKVPSEKLFALKYSLEPFSFHSNLIEDSFKGFGFNLKSSKYGATDCIALTIA